MKSMKSTTEVYSGNFLKNAANKAKEFLKKGYKNVKRNSKKIFNQIKKEFMGYKSPDQFKPGAMIAMNYDAKFKDNTIWDKNPLILCLGWSRNPKFSKRNFYGINFHHLKVSERVSIASFFVELSKKRGGKITYDDVKPFMNKFSNSPRPVLRQYIYKRVGGKVITMPSEQFLVAAAIPSEVIVRG